MGVNQGLWAVVPVKLFARTKRRLAPHLASHEREALARAMLADVLSALARTHSLAGVSDHGDADAAAMAYGWIRIGGRRERWDGRGGDVGGGAPRRSGAGRHAHDSG